MTRARLRDLGISIGIMPTGAHNAITDVPGVLVGHKTLIYDEPRIARTGVTVVVPQEGDIGERPVPAAYYSFNGDGEMTGSHSLNEFGLLDSVIALTNTHQVGVVRDALVDYEVEHDHPGVALAVVAETYDGWLNDIAANHVTKAHVYEALDSASGGRVPEGNVGGGTGMICHEFKGGIGTSSRVFSTPSGQFTVGALVQANYGDRHLLRVDGVPVGREIDFERVSAAWPQEPDGSSIIIIVATDAPLIPLQCKRVAQRATIGLARVGGTGHNGSGDIFLAFATGNTILPDQTTPHTLRMLPQPQMNTLFEATAEAVEEAILNALTAAETMVGYEGHTAHALPLDELARVMARYGRR